MGLEQHFEMSTVHLSLDAVAWLDAAYNKPYGPWVAKTPYGWLTYLPTDTSDLPLCLVKIAEYVAEAADLDEDSSIYILFDVDGEVIEALNQQHHYIIQHASARDDETGEPLTWNNTLGWGLGEPTIYRADEKENCQLPGLDCKWVEKPKEVK